MFHILSRLAPVWSSTPFPNSWTFDNKGEDQGEEKDNTQECKDAEGKRRTALQNPPIEIEGRDERQDVTKEVQDQRRFHGLLRIAI